LHVYLPYFPTIPLSTPTPIVCLFFPNFTTAIPILAIFVAIAILAFCLLLRPIADHSLPDHMHVGMQIFTQMGEMVIKLMQLLHFATDGFADLLSLPAADLILVFLCRAHPLGLDTHLLMFELLY